MKRSPKKIRVIENLAGTPDVSKLRKQLNTLFSNNGKSKPKYFDTLANNFKDQQLVDKIFLWTTLYIQGKTTVSAIRSELKVLKEKELRFTSDLRAPKHHASVVSTKMRD